MQIETRRATNWMCRPSIIIMHSGKHPQDDQDETSGIILRFFVSSYPQDGTKDDLSFCFAPFFVNFKSSEMIFVSSAVQDDQAETQDGTQDGAQQKCLLLRPRQFLRILQSMSKNNGFDFRMIRLKPRTEPRMDTHQFSGFRRPTPKPRTEPGMKLSLELQASPGCKPLHSHGMRNKAERLG